MSDPGYRTILQMFDMLRLLQRRGRRGMPVNDVARELGVNRRTVVRYLNALSASIDNELGEPIVHRELRDGTAWAVMPGERAPLTANIYQYAAVYAATRHLASQSLLAETAGAALDSLEEAHDLPSDLLERVAGAFCYVPWGPKDQGLDADVLDALVRGAIFRRPVDVVYRRPGAEEAGQWRLEPWCLVMYRDGMYLLGKKTGLPAEAEPYLYAVERFEDADVVRNESFEVPASFDPNAFFASGLGIWQTTDAPQTVRLSFTPEAANHARERRWPGGQRWTVESDCEVLELTVPITPEVVSWVAAWGPEIEVLAPASLRDSVIERHRAALARYVGQAVSVSD